ncbi:MAG: hypothetical protein DHS20C15_15990 [Planctomycetota bacterium]|nr:MAG: hypothetical protein DHS20C15_15990 [Planctomycetota bacterium]
MTTRLLLPTSLILGLCAATPFAQTAEPTSVPSAYSETVSSAQLFKGSTLMDLEIRALERDEACATIEDALLADDGQLRALLVSTHGDTDGLVLLPLETVSFHGVESVDSDEPRALVQPVKSAVLEIDAKLLSEAPRLVGEDRDAAISHARWLESRSYFGLHDAERTAKKEKNERAELHSTTLHRASTIVGHEVVDASNEGLGEISDFAFAGENDKVRYVVLECGGLMGLGEKQFAVPFTALEQVRVDDERTLRVPVSADRLEDLEGFERWPSKANRSLFAKNDSNESRSKRS